MEMFRNDDAGYLAWKSTNPTGYVLVSHNPPTGKYTSLHRADCGSLNPYDAAAKSWTVGYIKGCSTDKGEIEEWVKTHLHAEVTPCGHCRRAGRV